MAPLTWPFAVPQTQPQGAPALEGGDQEEGPWGRPAATPHAETSPLDLSVSLVGALEVCVAEETASGSSCHCHGELGTGRGAGDPVPKHAQARWSCTPGSHTPLRGSAMAESVHQPRVTGAPGIYRCAHLTSWEDMMQCPPLCTWGHWGGPERHRPCIGSHHRYEGELLGGCVAVTGPRVEGERPAANGVLREGFSGREARVRGPQAVV